MLRGFKGYSYSKRWSVTRKLINIRLSQGKKTKKLSQDEKFCSFFTHTLIPRKFSFKFPFVIKNTKREYFSRDVSRILLTDDNKYVINIILHAFFMLWWAIYYSYVIHLTITINDSFIFDFSTFKFLNKNYFSEIYFANEDLQDLNIGNHFDSVYYSTYINYFNLYLYPSLKIYDVLLNFEKFKYEEDVVLLGVDKAVKWSMDFFSIDLLNFQDNLLFILCIYEFYLDFNDYFFNTFNHTFFSRALVYNKSNSKVMEKDIKPFNFLTSTYFSFCTELLELGDKKKIFNKTLYKYFRIWQDTEYSKKDKGVFDSTQHIMDVKYFGIRIPYIFFLLYTWYSIYYRRVRYNFYIRGQQFFQEYAGRMHFFIWHNNPFSKNKAKMFILRYQKLFTIYHFKGYLEIKWFNDWFFFYSVKRAKMLNYHDLNNIEVEKSSFIYLINKAEIFLQNLNFKDYYIKYFDVFLYDYLLNYLINIEALYGYRLLMKTPLVKFKIRFSFGRLSYIEYKPMLENIFWLTADKIRLKNYMKKILNFEFFFKLYNNLYINNFFLKDFNNLYNKNLLIKRFKILTFYDKIVSIIFMNLDPFFFKYFWKRCFPIKWHKLWNIYDYIWIHLVLIINVYPTITFNIPKFDFSMYFLNWRIDVSESVIKNSFYSDVFNYTYIAINELYKNRFYELINKVNFLLMEKKSNLFAYQLFLTNYKNFIFELLAENIEYVFLFYIQNKAVYSNILSNFKFDFTKDFIYSTFIYRYYVFTILFSKFYYKDWFENWDKRILWIYKNFYKHEGPLFYSKKKDIF
jgi:hypothetical protein